MNWTLADGEALQLAKPDTFHIPPEEIRQNLDLVPNILVELIFMLNNDHDEAQRLDHRRPAGPNESTKLPEGKFECPCCGETLDAADAFSSEKMWVRILRRTDYGYVGAVNNAPALVNLQWGDEVTFEPRHVVGYEMPEERPEKERPRPNFGDGDPRNPTALPPGKWFFPGAHSAHQHGQQENPYPGYDGDDHGTTPDGCLCGAPVEFFVLENGSERTVEEPEFGRLFDEFSDRRQGIRCTKSRLILVYGTPMEINEAVRGNGSHEHGPNCGHDHGHDHGPPLNRAQRRQQQREQRRHRH